MSDDGFLTPPQMLERATSLSCELVVPRPDQLLLDIDTPAQMQLFQSMRSRFTGKLPHTPKIIGMVEWRSRNGNTHVLVDLDRHIQPLQRVLFEALLGSDPGRALAAQAAVMMGSPQPSVLFRPLGAATQPLAV